MSVILTGVFIFGTVLCFGSIIYASYVLENGDPDAGVAPRRPF